MMTRVWLKQERGWDCVRTEDTLSPLHAPLAVYDVKDIGAAEGLLKPPLIEDRALDLGRGN
jgi:hypothetical protein